MRAVVVREFGDIGLAKVEDFNTPSPEENEVLVEIHAVAVNFVDTLVLTGKYQFLPERPFSPGKGPAGVVIATGPGVTRFKTGDRVLAMVEHGGYAQAVSVSEDQCYLLPKSISFDEAASMSLCFDTAWFALFERARMAAGDSVLVLGSTGAVGNAAIQLAKAKGARVVAGITSDNKRAAVLAAGADETVDVTKPDIRESLRQQIYAVNANAGVDVIIDPIGGDIFNAALRCLAWRGRLVVIGFAAGGIPSLKVNYLLLKNIEVSGLQISDYRKRMPDMVRSCFEDVFDLYEQGKVVPMATISYALEDYAKAIADLTSRKQSGRLILNPQAKK